jgi:hypothetical protein
MKITARVLDLFVRFGGDMDMLSRAGTAMEKRAVDDQQWRCIDELLQEAFLLQNDRATSEYREQILKRLKEQTESDEIMKRILYLALHPPQIKWSTQ